MVLIENVQSLNINSVILTSVITGAIISTWYIIGKFRKGKGSDDVSSQADSVETNAGEIITRNIGTQTDVSIGERIPQTAQDQADSEEFASPDNIEFLSTSDDTFPVRERNNESDAEISSLVGGPEEWERYQQADTVWLNLAQLRKMEERINSEIVRIEVEQSYPTSTDGIELPSSIMRKMATKLRYLSDVFANCPPWLEVTPLEEFIEAIHRMF